MIEVLPSEAIVNTSTVQSVSFECRATGPPVPSITWIKEKTNTILTNEASIQITSTTNDDGIISSWLTIFTPRDPDESNYTCSAKNIAEVPADNSTVQLFVQGINLQLR